MSRASVLIRRASRVRSRLEARLLRGQYQKAICHLSEPLRDSAMREFGRQLARAGYLPYKAGGSR